MSKPVKIVIIVFIVIFLVIGASGYVAYRLIRKKATAVMAEKNSMQSQVAEKMPEAKEKLLAMLPADYDREKFSKAWDNFTQAAMNDNLRPMKALALARYLQTSMQDQKVTAQEADSLIIFLNESVKQ